MKKLVGILIILFSVIPIKLCAETLPAIAVEALFAEKKAAIKDSLKLTEKQSEAFWQLYDAYEKTEINIFNRRVAHIKEYLQEYDNLSNEEAKSMMKDYLQIEGDALKLKRALVKKFSEKLPPKIVFQFLVLEELLEAGFIGQIAENLPEIE